jgi:carboxypeptidase D
MILTNGAFDVYHITDTWPLLWDVMGGNGRQRHSASLKARFDTFSRITGPPQSWPGQKTNNVYFARPDVQSVIHAPHIDWTECSNGPVFVNGTDNSLPSTHSVLPGVIEKSKRTIISHGTSDTVFSATRRAQLSVQRQAFTTLFCFPLALA